jgi:hypothetical protein
MGAYVLLPLAVNSKSERKVNSLPSLGFEPVIFGMLAHLSDNFSQSHLNVCLILMKAVDRTLSVSINGIIHT